MHIINKHHPYTISSRCPSHLTSATCSSLFDGVIPIVFCLIGRIGLRAQRPQITYCTIRQKLLCQLNQKYRGDVVGLVAMYKVSYLTLLRSRSLEEPSGTRCSPHSLSFRVPLNITNDLPSHALHKLGTCLCNSWTPKKVRSSEQTSVTVGSESFSLRLS